MPEIACKVCGDLFNAKRCHILSGRAKYCSHECQSKGIKKQIKRICSFCKIEFYVPLSKVKQGGGIFCSLKCLGENFKRTKRTGIMSFCKVCGKEFYVQQHLTTKGRGKTCSVACRKKYVGIKLSGMSNPRWKGGIHKDRDGYVYLKMPYHHRIFGKGYVKRAVVIVEKYSGKRLQPGEIVHHINGIKDDDNPNNLMIVSRKQHNQIHGIKRRHGTA